MTTGERSWALITEPEHPRADVDIDRGAPVVVSTGIDVAAAVEIVWRVLADIGQWPSWNRVVGSMSIEPPNLIAWSGRTLAEGLLDLKAEAERRCPGGPR